MVVKCPMTNDHSLWHEILPYLITDGVERRELILCRAVVMLVTFKSRFVNSLLFVYNHVANVKCGEMTYYTLELWQFVFIAVDLGIETVRRSAMR